MSKQPLPSSRTRKNLQGESASALKPKGVLIKKAASGEQTSVPSLPRNASASAPIATAQLTDGNMQARIAQRAHELFQQRGGHHGQDLNDWFRAEQEVLENKCEPVS